MIDRALLNGEKKGASGNGSSIVRLPLIRTLYIPSTFNTSWKLF